MKPTKERLKEMIGKLLNKPTKPKKTNLGLIEYCEAQLGKPYWYGTFGQKATQSLYEAKKRQYPSYYTSKDFESQFGQKVHDCIGLIKGYMWTKDAESTEYTYQANGFSDLSANGYYYHCKSKGNISSIPEIPGLAVFMNGHVGVYIGGGEVIEARGHKYGVVKTKLKERPWRNWAYIDEIEYI